MKRDSFNVLFFIKKAKLLKNGEASVCMRITVNGARVENNIRKSRAILVESGEGVRQRQEPQILRLECLYRGCKNQTPPDFQ